MQRKQPKLYFRGTSRPEVFPFGGADNETEKPNKINVVGELNSPTWLRRNESIRRVYGTDGIAPTIPTGTGGGVMPKIVRPVITPDRAEKRQNGRRFKEDGDPAFTLTAQDRYGIYDGAKIRRLTPTECERLQGFPDGWTKQGTVRVPFHTTGLGIRQNYKTVNISDTQRYKTLGNAVTVNVIREIIKRIICKT